MKKILMLLFILAISCALCACGPDDGSGGVVTKDSAVTDTPTVPEPLESVTEPPASTSEEPSESVTEPSEPAVTTTPEPAPEQTTEPTTVSEAPKQTSTEATTTKKPETNATTTTAAETPDYDEEFEELEDEIINLDEYWALLGVDDGDLGADVEP